MGNVKKKIKKILPDRVVYLYGVFRLIPKYINCKVNEKNAKNPGLDFYTDEETVDLIIKNRCSMSRFGDGEFMWMSGEIIDSFQDYSDEFAKDLRNAFQSKNARLLIGIPVGIFDSSNCNIYAKLYWYIIRQDFLPKLWKFVDFNKKYCNASITRPYIDYKSKSFSEKAFKNIQRIWDKREIVIVEGSQTKLGIGNDLFNNAASIKRIVCPCTNAYEKIEEIKNAIRIMVPKSTMIIGALGPTASILAAQLTDEGYQFVDIGHVDVEYMWYLRNAILREPIEGKYVNESGIKNKSVLYDDDEKYVDSIVCRIN